MNKNAIGLHKFSRIFFSGGDDAVRFLCTPRADCNSCGSPKARCARTLPPHTPCRLQRSLNIRAHYDENLCLHTLRADCNDGYPSRQTCYPTLPPHAPCRLQPLPGTTMRHLPNFASTRSVQIATKWTRTRAFYRDLCLHTLRADCNARKELFEQHMMLCLHTLRADCNGRNAQNCNMHFSERVLSR